jgi:hypothetical protein
MQLPFTSHLPCGTLALWFDVAQPAKSRAALSAKIKFFMLILFENKI